MILENRKKEVQNCLFLRNMSEKLDLGQHLAARKLLGGSSTLTSVCAVLGWYTMVGLHMTFAFHIQKN